MLPGLVINWQYAPVHNATAASWTALVLVAPFPEAMLVEWVSTDRLVAINDPTPVDGSVTSPSGGTSGSMSVAVTGVPVW